MIAASKLQIRPLEARDHSAWVALRAALWPDAAPAELDQEAQRYFAQPNDRAFPKIVFAAERDRELIGMIELSLRSVADGCVSSPVPYIEGWFVVESARRRGVGRALVGAAEAWARAEGFAEMASDVQLENQVSEAAHKSLGFEEVERAILFRKALD
jgi:aminoglycoside 6'-N-acetyltransferase I